MGHSLDKNCWKYKINMKWWIIYGGIWQCILSKLFMKWASVNEKKKTSLQLERLSHRLWKEHWKSCHTDTGNFFEIKRLSFWLWKEQWRLPWNEKVVILAMERTVETSLKWKCWKEQWRLPWNENVVILAMERTVETSLKWKGCHSGYGKNSGDFLEMKRLSFWLWKEQWRLPWNEKVVILTVERTVETSLKWKSCHADYGKNSGDFVEMETSLKWKGFHSVWKNTKDLFESERLALCILLARYFAWDVKGYQNSTLVATLMLSILYMTTL